MYVIQNIITTGMGYISTLVIIYTLGIFKKKGIIVLLCKLMVFNPVQTCFLQALVKVTVHCQIVIKYAFGLFFQLTYYF